MSKLLALGSTGLEIIFAKFGQFTNLTEISKVRIPKNYLKIKSGSKKSVKSQKLFKSGSRNNIPKKSVKKIDF